jgi:hypothetical protein
LPRWIASTGLNCGKSLSPYLVMFFRRWRG